MVALYPNALIHSPRGSLWQGSGRLRFGPRWGKGLFFPSELILGKGSVVDVSGQMAIYNGARITLGDGARLKLGSGYINTGLTLDCFKEISIGDDVAIAKNVTIRDSDNHRIQEAVEVTKAVRIGNHVWIGMNSTVLKGVTIGDGAVVAAGSVVVRDVPSLALVAGVPARVVRRDVAWRQDAGDE
jgi:acetyltransferase-like isoleucine patch superfamily enzyme